MEWPPWDYQSEYYFTLPWEKDYLRPLYETQPILILQEDYNILGYLSTHTHMQISNDVRNGMKYV